MKKNVTGVKALFFKNSLVKIVSLILGVLLWGYVNSRGQVEMNFLVPLQLKNLPDNLKIVGRTPENIEVRVKGRESTLENLTSTRLAVTLDLSKVLSGENTVYLHAENINVPLNVEVTHLLPKTIALKIEPK
ncbi:MAG: CdaR family protein [Nitrospiria bacterium]